MSRDTGMDASSPGSVSGSSSGGSGGDFALLQRQNSLLQEEVGRLRSAESKLKDSEKARAELELKLRDSQGGSGGDAGVKEEQDTDATVPQLVRLGEFRIVWVWVWVYVYWRDRLYVC